MLPHVTNQTPIGELPELMLPAEAAAFLRISEWSVYDLVRRKKLPSVRLGRLVRIPRAAIQAMVAGQHGATGDDGQSGPAKPKRSTPRKGSR
jgi:excisionase family DNA binding protein